jgi:acetyltransferase-like isoleucine patch superfamily enzyme
MPSLPVKARELLRGIAVEVNMAICRRVWGMDIGEGSVVSLRAAVDKSNPKGVHIGRYTNVAFGAVILTHEPSNNLHVDTWIGDQCLIGCCSIIYPGIRIGNGCIVAAGSVVTRDIPDGCIVLGNPARIVERGVTPGKYGIRVDILPPDRVDKNMIA